MNPLKVLILITKSNWGGAQRYVYDLATRLPRDRFDVEVMTGTMFATDASDGPLIEMLRKADIPARATLPIGNGLGITENLKGLRKLVSVLRDKRPDVLHLNSSKIGVLGALAGRIARVPRIVFTAHGWAFNEDRPFAERQLFKLMYWIAMMLCHETIAVSHAAKKQVEGWPFIRSKLAVIHNGISKEAGYSRANARLELIRLNAELRKAVEGVPESKLVWIGTVAELHPVKGYEYALRAVAKAVQSLAESDPGKRIVYTAMGDGADRERLTVLASELGLDGTVVFMGHIPGAKEYMKAFDILLLSSISEALAYVLLEAGLAGSAVVATGVGGVPEIVKDMESGILVDPKNHKELSHAISFMIEHPEKRKAYGLALQDRVTREFGIDRMVRGVEEAYLRSEGASGPIEA